MTGFGRSELRTANDEWVVWEIRTVNGRGLEQRWKLPGGLDGLEPGLRALVGGRLKRGNVQCALTLRRRGLDDVRVDHGLLEQMLAMALDLAARVPGAAPPRAEALLALPGVISRGASAEGDQDTDDLYAAVRSGFALALDRLIAAREVEGARLGDVLRGLLSELDAVRAEAAHIATSQPEAQRTRLMQALDALLQDRSGLPETRIAQEVAMLAARSDVREELDRLASHSAGMATILDEGGAVGRRLDFLVQELAREANTVCSKSASLALTQTGLRLKGVIEQLREQVQNLE